MTARWAALALAAIGGVLPGLAAAKAPECYKVVPGFSIGPVAAGQPRHSGKLPPGIAIIPSPDGGTIGSVGLDLLAAPCFQLDGKRLRVGGWRPEALAARIGCGPVETGTGVRAVRCRRGGLGLRWTEQAGQVSALGLRVPAQVTAAKRPARPDEPSCDAYLLPGRSVVTAAGERKASARRPAGLAVARGKRYCLEGRVAGADWVEQRVLEIPDHHCGARRRGRQRVIACDDWGIRFVFGPKLTRVEVYPFRP